MASKTAVDMANTIASASRVTVRVRIRRWRDMLAATVPDRLPASGRLSLAGLVTHTIAPEQLGDAYEGLLKDKDHYLGVLVKWV